MDEVLEKGLKSMSVAEFKNKMKLDRMILLDTRHATEFTKGFVPGSVFVGLEGRFAEWAGSLLSFEAPMMLITETGKEKESIIRLARVGFDKVVGYLEGGYEAWKAAGVDMDAIETWDEQEMHLKSIAEFF